MLAFEYCECGCKGSESEMIGHTSFWLYDTLEGPVFLHRGHGRIAPLIKKYESYEEAVKLATDEARVLLNEEQAKLDNIRKQLNEKPAKVLSFKKELLFQFPGKDNEGIRRLIRECRNSRQIRLLSKSVAFTELGRSKLEIVAEAFDRPVSK
jgi:hypothetical protein